MKGKKPLIIGGAVVALVIVIVLFVWFTAAGLWPTVLDIVLIITALVSMLLLGALIYAVLSLTRTVLNIKSEVMPVLDSLKTTTSAVREGAKTASAFGVDPAVRTAGLIAGAGEVASVILGRGHTQKRVEKRQKRRLEIERELIAKGEVDGYR